jgi:nitrogen-specific signal transduction histidine kinase
MAPDPGPDEFRGIAGRGRADHGRDHLLPGSDERKKQEQQSLRLQRIESIGTLAGGIAHDLNNSLAPVIMALDLLKMERQEPATRDLIELASASAHRGAELVRRILEFGVGVEGQRAEVRIPPLIAEIEKMAIATFPSQLRLRTSVALDVAPVMGDSTQLYRFS